MAKKEDAPTAHNVRQQEYYKRQLGRGLKKVGLFVPETALDEFWDQVEKMRRRWCKQGLLDD